MRTIRFVTALAILLAFSVVATAAAGTLRFQTSFDLRDRIDACPPEYPAASTVCRYVTSTTLVKGLGRVTVTQRSIIDQVGGYRVRASGTFAVPGLGELVFAGDNSAYPGSRQVRLHVLGRNGSARRRDRRRHGDQLADPASNGLLGGNARGAGDDVRPCGSVVHPHEPHRSSNRVQVALAHRLQRSRREPSSLTPRRRGGRRRPV